MTTWQRVDDDRGRADCGGRQHDDDNATTREGALRYIYNLHEMARSVGEGVMDLGMLLYPPLDFSSMTTNDHDREIADDNRDIAPRLGRTALGSKLECQLHAILECVTIIAHVDAAAATSATSSPITSRKGERGIGISALVQGCLSRR